MHAIREKEGVARMGERNLDQELVEREIERTKLGDRSGPAAENILRDLGAVRHTPH